MYKVGKLKPYGYYRDELYCGVTRSCRGGPGIQGEGMKSPEHVTVLRTQVRVLPKPGLCQEQSLSEAVRGCQEQSLSEAVRGNQELSAVRSCKVQELVSGSQVYCVRGYVYGWNRTYADELLDAAERCC